ncbi:PQQ-like beta-propeller repeat protein [Lignipirellula cremea]|uniref:Outer membrane biogenesis protein BamB n=1 Tax=Lignipirellula cremea TaxID=2528010 RepID=A0A518E428_9BACT|nr:PQQ-like beta-propeller repeat protein [Lignipirellula cremea]QDU98831.1 outer membrane biogenesis protein BamB [Lignipirellula cremea]
MMNLFHSKFLFPARCCVIAVALLGAATACCEAEEPPALSPPRWPGFLGAGATPLHAKSLPLHWSAEQHVAWKTPLSGQGQSSPVIWDDRIFVTSISGALKNDCHVAAVRLTSGELLWDYQTPSAQPVRANYFQSRSAPTPVVDGERVYAFFETGKLIALTHEGKEVWTRDLPAEYGEFEVRIGLAASLLQTAHAVVAVVDHEGPSYILAVDKTSGETLWKTERFSRQSYASPSLIKIGGQEQIVCSSSGSVDGYDAHTGKLLWTFEDIGANNSSTPLDFGEGRFLVGASPGMNDERLSDAKRSNLAMQVTAGSGDFQPSVLWRTEKAMPSFGSPMVHQGYAYWVTKAGVLFCFNAETGEQAYIERIGLTCWATPLGVDNRIYLFGKDGVTKVIAAGPEFQLLAENILFDAADPLSEMRSHRTEKPLTEEERASNRERMAERGLTFADPVQYGYAAVDGRFVIRTGAMLYCITENESEFTRLQEER